MERRWSVSAAFGCIVPAHCGGGCGVVWALALVVGVVGGIYGIGGGPLLAPILIALGFSVYEVAPATLAATFLTSVVGIATYQDPSTQPRWANRARMDPRRLHESRRLRRELLRRTSAKPSTRTVATTPTRLRRLPRGSTLLPDGRDRTASAQSRPPPRAHLTLRKLILAVGRRDQLADA
jgi:hypothetical protein